MPLELNPGLLVYLIIVNLVTLIVFAVDKISSQSNAWRTRERTLLLLTLLGGTVGALFAMYFFRHKTRKGSFLMLFSVILLIQLALVFLFFQNETQINDSFMNVP
ncbi:MAG: hypothetical protein A3I29_01380 [Candidatus Magasanikbacteria bacterium RIFCSPLOWO2_02_FULL_44_11]|uniref:DUF1294 domain-containing protein n=2 Tax=Candidatus Magasanikiibacteriota TaxID=1752731 RepID=A0A1F6N9R4_9BACT|nr:MAG: hypothetical protein A3D53_00690 [Candidatus Magasanikbacteria bacterium RIFCSPHIGHO2_02_FULL_45_10]OGH80664.1 MAG: hypothetical protein A3I29_01380 [Candidatus Magasanikbacteria bacterium RIFCSPLOWO2_02_FULL_44_11]